MSIKKMDEAMTVPVKNGQYICKASVIEDEICGAPKLVESVSNTRVYIKGEDDRTTYIAKSSVVFVCDTKDEGDSMYALSKQQSSDLRSSKLAIIESYMKRVMLMIK